MRRRLLCLSAASYKDKYKNEQLEAFGWEAMGEESGEKLSWSGWTIDSDGQTWAGTLTLTASPTAANQHSATLSIQEMSANS
jgi:hypothetical protein